ncbi:DUF2306 domain-containing protein [Streptomyces chartreusis]|uniref:DUF2306 domain-containing protein n=1 Tax=Streptomyces chartreusis TaxID=1969 RepID=UPI0033DE725B
MRQTEDSPITAPQPGEESPDGRMEHVIRPARRKRPRNIALGVLAFVVVGIVVSMWAQFTTRVSDHLFVLVLVVHVVGSTVAILACVLQVWPWLRRTRPRVHRISGRAYVIAGVYPASITALVLTAFWPFSPLTSSRDILASVLWLAITTYGFVLARQGRTADHRRWMLRSFALTLSVVVSSVIRTPVGLLLQSHLHTDFHGSDDVMQQMWSGIDLWLSMTLSLIAVEWYLEREQLRRSSARRSRKTDPSAGGAADRAGAVMPAPSGRPE